MRVTDSHIAGLVRSGPDGETALIELLAEKRDIRFVAALGEATGPAGENRLRSIVADHGRSDDERCAALIALAKRVGERGSDCFSEALADRRSDVKDCAAICLAAFGDDRAWDRMVARLKVLLKKPARHPAYSNDLSAQPPALVAIGYLARHAGTAERADVANTMIRDSWDRFRPEDHDWVRRYWPAAPPVAHPGDASGWAESSRQQFAAWKNDGLFDLLYAGDSPMFGGGPS